MPGKARDFKKLRRLELLELLVEMGRENDRLAEELKSAQEALEQRALKLGNVGSMAEAALLLNDVFVAADAACAHYIESVKMLSSEDHLVAGSRVEAKLIVAQAQSEADKIRRDACAAAQELIDAARRDAEAMLGEAESILNEALDEKRRLEGC